MPELTKRYIVMTMATEAPFDLADTDGVFVLKPWKDPAALRALMAYRDNCYPELGRDLDDWIRVIASGAVVRGDVGRRNEPHLITQTGSAAGGGPRRRARSGTARTRARTATRPKARGTKRPKRRR
jgi:hypothetical protein